MRHGRITLGRGSGLRERRKLTHRAGAEDGYRWKKHLAPHVGHLKPGEVDAARIRAFVETKLAEGLNPATVRVLVAILSSLFVDLVERSLAPANPARSLPRATMRLMRPTHDPRTTPFVEKLADVRRIYLDLPAPLSAAYALGALAGLRTGEVFALQWQHVDLATRRIHVRESVKGPLKDKDSRMVPILDALLPILKAWKLKTGGEGRVIPPMHAPGKKIDKHTPGTFLRAARPRPRRAWLVRSDPPHVRIPVGDGRRLHREVEGDPRPLLRCDHGAVRAPQARVVHAEGPGNHRGRPRAGSGRTRAAWAQIGHKAQADPSSLATSQRKDRSRPVSRVLFRRKHRRRRTFI